MTQEEKAKAYDNALEIAKGLYAKDAPDSLHLERMFPQLKESEDENIRKAIHIYFDWLDGRKDYQPKGEYTIRDMIAWLEKQGEQKQETSYPKFDYDDILAMQCCMETAEKVTKDKELYEKLKSLHSRLHDAYLVEKQGEQEPQVYEAEDGEIITYSETDGYKLVPNFKVRYAGRDYDVLKVKDVSGVRFYGIEDEPNHIDYVKAEDSERVDGSTYPTKPAVFSEHKLAWNEEDKDIMYNIISNLTELKDRYGEEYGKVGKCIDWIKSLKDRVGCEANCTTTKEWSEEDEKKRNLLIDILNVNHPNGVFKVNPINTPNMEAMHTEELVSWLKSLKDRYAWKPSDEQMKAFENFVRGIWESCYDSPYENKAKLLYSLLSDLKKLRKE